MSLPTVTEVRDRIEKVNDKEVQMFLKAVYLFAARPAELAGAPCSGDKFKPIGPKGKDAWFDEISPPNPPIDSVLEILDRLGNKQLEIEKVKHDLSLKVPVAVFKLNVAKTSPEEGEDPDARLVALPMSEKYEPWTKELHEYFKKAGSRYPFPHNRQYYWHIITNVQKVFKGMFYTTQTKKGLPKIRELKMNGLRVIRATELIEKYSFDLYDLREFIGLNLDVHGLPVRFEAPKNFYQGWQRYIKKLCIEQN